MCKWAKPRTASSSGRIASCAGGAFYRFVLFLFTIRICRGVLVNRTIDSAFGDPVTHFIPIYQPQDFWSNQTQECAAYLKGKCTAYQLPYTSEAFDGTWNWTIYDPDLSTPSMNITLQFTGVAIWVFFILSDLYSTGLNITLDGQHTEFYSPDSTGTGLYIYNATIFSKSGLTNAPHELIIETASGYLSMSYLNFDWAMYSVDPEASTSQKPSASQTTSTSQNPSSSTFPSNSSLSHTASATSTAQSSSSKIGTIVGCTLGGLAAIALVLVFLVRRLRRAPQVRDGAEGILDIDIPPHYQPYCKREIPVSEHDSTQSKAARLREARQRELDERIRSAQHELESIRLDRNAGSAGDIGNPSAAGPSQSNPELALLRNEMQQLRDRVGYLQAQRESDWELGLSNEPPAYTQLSNIVQ